MRRESNGEPSLSMLEQQLLFVILRLQPNGYGTTIRDMLIERAGREVTIGAVYAALDRLEEKGFVQTREGDPEARRGGRRKTFFSITGVGQRALKTSVDVTNRMLDGLEGLEGALA